MNKVITNKRVPLVKDKKLYGSLFPNFKSNYIPSRTETIDSDLTYSQNGRVKTPLI